MKISPACKRTIATWPYVRAELERRIKSLAKEGFIVDSVEIAPEKYGQRFIMVWGQSGMRCWRQETRKPA